MDLDRRGPLMGLIDVHAHYLPPVYREALAAAGIDRPDGMPAVPDWSVGAHVALMDRLGIDAALLSVSSPGVRFGDGLGASDAVALARAVNDVGATTAREHPGRFGVFASLPLPDVEAAIAEVERALDGLGLDGVVLMTNVDGVYLGDPALDPLMAELDRRGAVAFVHPTSPPCAAALSLGLPRPLLEFPFDSTRAVANLVFGGTLARYPRVRWIVPHAGGTLPFLARRLAQFRGLVARGDVDVLAALASLHYDLAGSANATSIGALLTIVDVGRVLYGSDWPFTPEAAVAAGVGWITSADNPVAAAQLRGSAEALFPRLTARSR